MPIVPKRGVDNAVVFLDVTIADRPVGRLKFELFLPAGEAFRRLFTGEICENGRPVGFNPGKLLSRLAAGRVLLEVPFLRPDAASVSEAASPDQGPGLVCADADGVFVSLVPQTTPALRVLGEVFDEESLFVLRMIGATPGEDDGRFRLAVKIAQAGQY